jgi:hypothetical protein
MCTPPPEALVPRRGRSNTGFGIARKPTTCCQFHTGWGARRVRGPFHQLHGAEIELDLGGHVLVLDDSLRYLGLWFGHARVVGVRFCSGAVVRCEVAVWEVGQVGEAGVHLGVEARAKENHLGVRPCM